MGWFDVFMSLALVLHAKVGEKKSFFDFFL